MVDEFHKNKKNHLKEPSSIFLRKTLVRLYLSYDHTSNYQSIFSLKIKCLTQKKSILFGWTIFIIKNNKVIGLQVIVQLI
jgi:hypothetical protein